MPRPRLKSPPARPRPAEAEASSHHRIRRDHTVETAQDYVEAIAALIALSGEARAVDLAKRLGVTHVTVVRRVARLKEEGLVTAEPYRAIFLTEAGRRLAAECRQRHDTVLAFLLAVGVPAEAAERDAEGIEHHVSPETLAAFRKVIAVKRA